MVAVASARLWRDDPAKLDALAGILRERRNVQMHTNRTAIAGCSVLMRSVISPSDARRRIGQQLRTIVGDECREVAPARPAHGEIQRLRTALTDRFLDGLS
jgi:hypothetical protein